MRMPLDLRDLEIQTFQVSCPPKAASPMGWLRLVGSLKLQVSFAEYRLFYRALLQKRPVILRSLLIVATPYVGKEARSGELREESE